MTCASTADCAGDQVCGSDALCAAPEVAGRCGELPGVVDAGVGPGRPDAPPLPPDAALPMAVLRVELAGRGRVEIAGLATCLDSPCVYVVLAGQALELRAIAEGDHRFEKWEQGPCDGQGATCNAIAVAPMIKVKARFKHQ
ncbi:MAG: hypothetical protein KIT31_16540 [Deltaproteobacteria bacterium]|nr:hypothetical protein [Deltaproteobacteria bacterium]